MVFEFHFNPKEKEDLVFDTFCSEPENIYEKRMGGLFMVGELKNALPHNYRLLDKTAATIRKEFYSKFQRTHEKALKESLQRSNEMLSGEVSRENTDWLGNFNFAIITLKNFELNFTKVGDMKIFLLRGPHVIDIGAKLNDQEIEPYPLKIFNKIVSGKLGNGDMILLITRNIFPALKGIISDIAKISPFDEKKLKDLLKTKEKELAELSGAFVLICAQRVTAGRKPKIIFQREIEKFSIKKEVLLPTFKFLKKSAISAKKIPSLIAEAKSRFKFSFRLPKLKKTPPPDDAELAISDAPKEIAVPVTKTGPIKIKVKVVTKETEEQEIPKAKPFIRMPKLKIPALKIPELRMPSVKFPKLKIPKLEFNEKTKHRLVPAFLLLIFLAAGFFIFKGEGQKKAEEYLVILDAINGKVVQAESFMILRENSPQAAENAYLLLSEAWEEIIPLANTQGAVGEKVRSLKTVIENNLKDLSNSVKIDNPETVFEFRAEDFIPQKIVSDGKNLYLFSPYAQDLFIIDESGNERSFQADQKFFSAYAVSENELFLFEKPDKIVYFGNGQFSENFTLKSPYPGFNSSDLAYFQGNLYFLDSTNGEIVRYPSPLEEIGKDNPQLWLYRSAEKPVNGKSIAVDGSVWVLNADDRILRYRAGNLQEMINPAVFPEARGFSKIYINPALPYIFILESVQNRIIVLDKQGGIVKQIESPEFDNLVDIAVSGDTIWILNGLKIYKINY
ncbi:MAG: hypothetical protein V1756_00320 [Patescibacteria group bacterium]